MVHKLLPIRPVVYNFSPVINNATTFESTGSQRKAKITYRASPNFGNCTLFLMSTVKFLAALRSGTFCLQKERRNVRTIKFESNLTIYTIWLILCKMVTVLAESKKVPSIGWYKEFWGVWHQELEVIIFLGCTCF